jgi:DNA-directed RNA polymerase specialized sigma subunit
MEKVDFINFRALVHEVRQLKSYAETLDRAGARYHEVNALFEKAREKAEGQVVAIEKAIQSLDSPAERLVMRLRYLEGRSWASVVTKLSLEGYSERQVYYIHGAALEKLKGV